MSTAVGAGDWHSGSAFRRGQRVTHAVTAACASVRAHVHDLYAACRAGRGPPTPTSTPTRPPTVAGDGSGGGIGEDVSGVGEGKTDATAVVPPLSPAAPSPTPLPVAPPRHACAVARLSLRLLTDLLTRFHAAYDTLSPSRARAPQWVVDATCVVAAAMATVRWLQQCGCVGPAGGGMEVDDRYHHWVAAARRRAAGQHLPQPDTEAALDDDVDTWVDVLDEDEDIAPFVAATARLLLTLHLRGTQNLVLPSRLVAPAGPVAPPAAACADRAARVPRLDEAVLAAAQQAARP